LQGTKPENIPEFTQRDIENVVQHARVILKISSDEKAIELKENPNPRLGIIAVIGPTTAFGQYFEEALLAEVGIGASRPYHRASGLLTNEGYANKRRKWFSLSSYQYQLVAPIIFKKIEAMAYKKVASRRTGLFSNNRFLIPTYWHRWSRRYKKLIRRNSFIPTMTGARFAVSLRDEFFVQDIFWAEFNLNRQLKHYLTGIVNFIDLRLNWYNYRYKGKKAFSKLEGAIDVEKSLKRPFLTRHRHLQVEIVRRLKEEKRSSYWPHLAEMIDWNGRDFEERTLASLACSHADLSDPRSRLQGIQLQVTTGLEKNKDHIVFEVSPRKE